MSKFVTRSNWDLTSILESEYFFQKFCENCIFCGTAKCCEDVTDKDCLKNETYVELEMLLEETEKELDRLTAQTGE